MWCGAPAAAHGKSLWHPTDKRPCFSPFRACPPECCSRLLVLRSPPIPSFLFHFEEAVTRTQSSGVLNGFLNELFVPNCRSCRDDAGNYCSFTSASGAHSGEVCASKAHTECPTLLLDDSTKAMSVASCPRTCLECPGYESDARGMFIIVFVMALSSVVSLTATMPFLRGRRAGEFHRLARTPVKDQCRKSGHVHLLRIPRLPHLPTYLLSVHRKKP
ncbi:MAG: hypothetical protein SGPRY_014253 [Prymnesium sp.]